MANVSRAKQLARRWVDQNARTLPGFSGAYLTGSTTYMADKAPLPTCSDVDVKVVIDASDLPESPGKFAFHDVILEVGYTSLAELADPDKILADYHRAGAFRKPTAISDPTGRLGDLQKNIAARFSQREWVLKRCEHARATTLHWLNGVELADPLHDRVTAWLFAAGLTTHIILVAGLANPTIRRRYAECRHVLEHHDRLDLHERMLETLGSKDLDEPRISRHLAELGSAYDLACAVLESPYRFAADMTAATRVVAIDGSLEMIEQGRHRESMFWILAVYCRSRAVVSADASNATLADFDRGYRRLLRSLGINTVEDLRARAARVRHDLGPVWEAALSIINSNPEVS